MFIFTISNKYLFNTFALSDLVKDHTGKLKCLFFKIYTVMWKTHYAFISIGIKKERFNLLNNKTLNFIHCTGVTTRDVVLWITLVFVDLRFWFFPFEMDKWIKLTYSQRYRNVAKGRLIFLSPTSNVNPKGT